MSALSDPVEILALREGRAARSDTTGQDGREQKAFHCGLCTLLGKSEIEPTSPNERVCPYSDIEAAVNPILD